MSRDVPHDPLGRDLIAAHAVELPVLGVPVRFETNEVEALEVVEKAYGEWRALAARPDLVSGGRALVRIITQGGDERGSGIRIRSRLPDGDRLLLHTSGSVALADASGLEAIAYVTHQLLLADHFREGVLDALTLFLVTALGRHPLHAAAVMRDGTALLLAGRSGTGKSTLAYVAQRAGFQLLSDDAIYIQLSPKLRAWGLGRGVFLPLAAQERFPELGGLPTVERANGDQKIALRAVGLPVPDGRVAERVGICVLERAAKPSLQPLSADAVAGQLGANLEPGFDRFAGTTRHVLERVASGGAWKIGLSEDPEENLRHVRTMFADMESGS